MHHTAVFSVGPRAPLELRQVPTPTPVGDQVRILNEWTSTQPFDLHKADGALAQYPDITGDGSVGTVVEVGDQVKRLQVGDKVSFPLSFLLCVCGRLTIIGLWIHVEDIAGARPSDLYYHPGTLSCQGTSSSACFS